MAKSTEADAESVNGRLAEFLSSRKEEMIRAWIGRVNADPLIPSENLTASQLRNHLPRLLDDLAETLRRYRSPDVATRTEKDAEKHGRERWQQGYDLPQLLREIMHLRGVVIYHLRVFEEQYPEYGTAARLFTSSTVHQFLDQMGIEAAEQFLASDKKARRARSGMPS